MKLLLVIILLIYLVACWRPGKNNWRGDEL